MNSKFTVLVILSLVGLSLQSVDNNEVEVEDVNPFQEAASALFQDGNMQNLGGMLNNFMQSGGGKQMGDLLMGAMTGNSDPTSQILQGLGNVLNQNTGKGGQSGGFDPSIIGNVLGMLGNVNSENSGGLDPNIIGSVLGVLGNSLNANSRDSPKSKDSNDLDLGGGLLNILGSLMNSKEGANFMNYIPMVLSTINSFVGPEAESRAEHHKDHAWLLPPILEKVHLLFDHFMHSELGKTIMERVGTEKFVKIFSDENGQFNYEKFIELLENQSFRKHWIKMVTSRLADGISYFADPSTQKRYMQTVQFFLNSFLKGQGFPKGSLFDPSRPVDSITSAINHLSKRFLGQKYNARMYVKPAVEYVQELFRLAENKGFLGRAFDSSKLSDKLADTINLDIIEPVVRVNRAHKFAKKVPECDKYVMCLVNQDEPDDSSSLPGLKKLLSKTTSTILSWFLSTKTGTPYWTLYNIIAENTNCPALYKDSCNDFHIDELRVTTEYVHNEL